MNSFGKKCIELRKKDLSINDIVKITGHGKSSIYPYIKNIPLSKERLKKVRRLHTERIVKFNKKRRGLSLKKFKRFDAWDKHTVLLVSHLLFDGQIDRSGCVYHNRNRALTERFSKHMRKVYLHKPKMFVNKKTDVMRVSYYNVALATYMKQKSDELLNNVHKFPSELKCAFLKAFFDDEGCMDFRQDRNLRRVRGYQNDIKMLKLIQNLLKDFGVNSSIRKSYVHEVVITGKKNLIRFRDEINFSPGVRINGNRSNSVWKKHLEKRKILDMAIESYQN